MVTQKAFRRLQRILFLGGALDRCPLHRFAGMMLFGKYISARWLGSRTLTRQIEIPVAKRFEDPVI
jgi:hypothetical protein